MVESLSFLDVNELNRLGAFARPMIFPWMALKTSRHLMEYRPDTWREGRPPQRIPIQWTRCRFGGSRPWMTCLCGRRVGKLYYGNGFLGCRQCGEMRYQSQCKGRRGRFHLKATRIRMRLFDYGRPGIDAIPPRPWRMWRSTYARLKARLAATESELTGGRTYRPSTRRTRWNYALRG